MKQADINATIVNDILPQVLQWFGAEPLEDTSKVKASLTLALEHSGDTYERIRFLDTVRGWPCDGGLCLIMLGAEKIERRIRNGRSVFGFIFDRPINAPLQHRFGD